MRKLVACLFAVALALALAACGESTPTCSEAMNNLYGQGCALVVGGEQVSLSDAISGCEQTRSVAAECGCGGTYDNALVCLDGLGPEECNGCDAEFASYNTCMSGCS